MARDAPADATEGLDVNVKFNGGFEFTSDLAIFDLLDVRLVHGWRVGRRERRRRPERKRLPGPTTSASRRSSQLRTDELEGAAKARAELVSAFLERTKPNSPTPA